MPVRETTAGGMTRPGSTRADHSCTSWLPATSINPISVMRSRSALAPVVSRSRKTRLESNIADLSGQGLHHFILARECIIDALGARRRNRETRFGGDHVHCALLRERAMSAAPQLALQERIALPDDHARATLIGRAWVPGPLAGPSPVLVSDGRVYDLSQVAPTCSDLMNSDDPGAVAAAAIKNGRANFLGRAAELLANSAADRRDPSRAHFLCPVDLQAVRACGVTFIASMLERVIEEQAKGDPSAAESIRISLGEEIGGELRSTKPGSSEAMRLKASLVRRGMWSQYLEVGIGPDAEIFTKAQPLSAVGTGAEIGILSSSSWNNPEPELVLIVNYAGKVVGATLGNDVNLRDYEGRSALLLGRAKDNNASCALGPLIRLFDRHYGVSELDRKSTRLN